MSEVYCHAERVVVWLGSAADNSDCALRAMEEIGDQIDVDFKTLSLKPMASARDQTLVRRDVDLPLAASELEAIYFLFCRPWFERLWIRQEIYFANSSAILTCGLSTVTWQTFRRAWALFGIKQFAYFENAREFLARLMSLTTLLHQDVSALFPYLRQFLGPLAECGNLRDRIYGILSFSTITNEIGIVPNYTMDFAGVCKDVTWWCMVYFEDLEVLTECEPSLDALNGEALSWVPDWSSGPGCSAGLYYTYCASGPFVSPPTLVDDRQLQVLTLQIGHVQTFQHGFTSDYQTSMPEQLRRLFTNGNASQGYIGGGGLLEAYVEALLLGIQSTDPGFSRIQTSLKALYSLITQDHNRTDKFTAQLYLLHKAMRQKLFGRVFLETCSQYVGLGPETTKLGDEVHIVIGCGAPLILRPVGNGQHKVVGTCYIAGVQGGKTFLGSLPQGWRRTCEMDESFGSPVPRFMNDDTGECTARDPRLDKWSTTGFKKVDKKYAGWSHRYEVNEEDLRSRGINARYINLV